MENIEEVDGELERFSDERLEHIQGIMASEVLKSYNLWNKNRIRLGRISKEIKRRKMRAVIDVDNTLCEYSFVLYDELNKINKAINLPIEWDDWDFYKGLVSDEDFYKAADLAQNRIMECGMVPGAKEFTHVLSDLGYEIVIASHRQDKNKILLEKWLNKNNIKFDKIHISFDKTVLFDDESVRLVVEDSPVIIKESCNRGITTIGIRRPWNRNMKEKNLFMINNYTSLIPNIKNILGD